MNNNELLIRMDANMQNLSKTTEKLTTVVEKLDNRLDKVELSLQKHAVYMNEHPKICNDILEVKSELHDLQLRNKSRWGIIRDIGVVGVVLFNMYVVGYPAMKSILIALLL